MRVSVAMATYNGAAYLMEQLDSILEDLEEQDEIVVSDDGSTDETLDILRRYQKEHPNIILLNGPGKGVFSNFEHAFTHCRNELIFCSDQDDLWLRGKKDRIVACFDDSGVNVLLHNGVNFSKDNETASFIRYRKGVLQNLLKSAYWGCCMAVRKSFLDAWLPFGFERGIAHDQLIGLLGEATRTSLFLDEVWIRHRIHENNMTRVGKMSDKIVFRMQLLGEFRQLRRRKNKNACVEK